MSLPASSSPQSSSATSKGVFVVVSMRKRFTQCASSKWTDPAMTPSPASGAQAIFAMSRYSATAFSRTRRPGLVARSSATAIEDSSEAGADASRSRSRSAISAVSRRYSEPSPLARRPASLVRERRSSRRSAASSAAGVVAASFSGAAGGSTRAVWRCAFAASSSSRWVRRVSSRASARSRRTASQRARSLASCSANVSSMVVTVIVCPPAARACFFFFEFVGLECVSPGLLFRVLSHGSSGCSRCWLIASAEVLAPSAG
ncbi:unnamed protein product [Pelagomonas calceolata]|uniref:Uncharacterized protein n=1 Tax=Pelagomonas calceolata TaxID=35677 RepID=A0A8J2X483_9STRA|nr:unnamed protein product [Pelagomonas calceolata]|mmetsp:Transcript_9934/g.28941  ORF Transcript_9934/g.28941 Transcript_9934/m.28941 type:complete len:260 (-) Transcript_9934:8-787(-)